MLKKMLQAVLGALRARRTDRATELIAAGRRAENAGRLDEATTLYRKATAVAPEYVAAHVNLGIALAAASDVAGAAIAYEDALGIDPCDPYANYNFGNLLYRRGEHARAEQLLRSATDTKADFTEAHIALSNALDALGRTAEAAEALEAALCLQPSSTGALFNYGVVLRKLRRGDEAAAALEQSLALAPGNIDALEALSAVLQEEGLTQESMRARRAALELAPERFDLESDELFALNKDESLGGEILFAKHRDFGLRLERAFPARFAEFDSTNDPDRRLKIGYVSGDFSFHPVAQFLLVPLEHRDRIAFEIFCYATSPARDPVTERLRALADHWIDAAQLSDVQLADVIHRDAIDILIDLSGHAGVFRLAMFAQRPAPVQVAWLGYLNTTGLTRIDYRICDTRTDPPGISDPLHTEVLVRLPHSQWCYRPYLEVEAAQVPPCIANGYVTFGSSNHAAKISQSMCLRWAEILRRVADSHIVFIGISSDRKVAELTSTLIEAGVAAERVRILPRLAFDEYARWYNQVDIALDTLPYGGGTTTFDALWMGVPVVTAIGSLPVSRSAASIVSLLGLSEWVAQSPNEYIDVAVERASDLQAIASLRGSLRQRLRDSPLMDEARFTRDLESAYRRMWRAWCSGGSARK